MSSTCSNSDPQENESIMSLSTPEDLVRTEFLERHELFRNHPILPVEKASNSFICLDGLNLQPPTPPHLHFQLQGT